MPEKTKMRSVFCRNINRLFTESGKQKKDLAKFIGVSDNTVTAWVSGRKVPRMDKIDMICDFFHVERKDIIVSDIQRDKQTSVLSDTEIELIKKYRSLDARGRENVSALIDRELYYLSSSDLAGE